MTFTHAFTEAFEYAADVHRTQVRKGTDTPYIGHLLGVASIVVDAGGTQAEVIAALLHDAPEDQGGLARLIEIRERFGDVVAQIVQGCSDPLSTGGKDHRLSYDERKAAYLKHLRSCDDKSVYLVSVADKLHNARATLMDLRTHGSKVWDRFNADREKLLENYENLIDAYEGGPPDKRRTGVVRELRLTIAELRLLSDA